MWARYAMAGLMLLGGSTAFAQGTADPAAVDYIFVDGRPVHLTEIKDAPFYRIQGNSKMAQTESVREPLRRVMGITAVHNGPDELAFRKSAEMAGAARESIARLTRIQEADQLRVFTTDGGRTLLVEYPEIILQCDETTTLAEVQQYLRTHYQVTVEPTRLRRGQFLVRLLTPSHTLWLANQLKSTTAIPVRYADVNFWFAQPSGNNPPRFPQQWSALPGAGLPADPGFADQWALENRASRPGALAGADTGFARAYRIAPLDASGIKVAVLDYAIDVDHPELMGAIDSVFNATRYDTRKGMNDPALKQLDFVEQPEAEADHGTACAGIIAALTSNKIGVSGVASGAKIVAIQISTPGVEDLKIVSGLTIIAALQAAQAAQAQIVSLSWALRLPSHEALDSVRAEINSMNAARGNKGTLIVSAAGNEESLFQPVLEPDFPADYSDRAPNVIAAGASNWCGEAKRNGQCDMEVWTSRFNDHTLFAPGVDIFTITNRRDKTTPNALNNYRVNFNGTSAATPFIAAAAALVLKKHPDWTAAQVRQHLMRTAGKLKGGDKAVLDICNALYGVARCSSHANPP